VNLSTLICVYLVILVVSFSWMVRSIYRFNKKLPCEEQVVALKEGETFVGVIERRRGQYVFIGNDLGRYEESLTPQEIRLLRQEFYKGYE